MVFHVHINGAYNGTFQSLAEAMAHVEKWARPFNNAWKILDGHNQIIAQS